MVKVSLQNVSVQFEVRRHGRVTLKEYVLKGMFHRKRNPIITVDALNGVSFDAREGDRLGVIGHNGAGKSTLLKLIAGVYPPTTGKREVIGRTSSLFDVTLGFELDASGWENIKYRAYLLGETPQSITPKMKEIAEFSELGEYLDMPLRYYSTGMIVRLGFSIATAIHPEILIVDEVLGAGDQAFLAKARQRMDEMFQTASLVVLASHDLNAMEELCSRVIWMDHGTIREMGMPRDVIAAYSAQQAEQMAKLAA